MEPPTTLFEQWYAQYREPIARYIATKLQDRSRVEDLTQETFVHVWCALARKGTIEHPQAYLYRTATNLCIDQARRRRVIGFQSLEESDHSDQCTAPDAQAAYEVREHLYQTFERLPPKYRRALFLCFQEGYSYAQIAQALKIAPTGVKMFLSRARRHFRQRYKELIEDSYQENSDEEAQIR